jgi:Tfp pilus assembly protein PilX
MYLLVVTVYGVALAVAGLWLKRHARLKREQKLALDHSA